MLWFKISGFFLVDVPLRRQNNGLNPKVIAGKLSVTRFINKICKAKRSGTCQQEMVRAQHEKKDCNLGGIARKLICDKLLMFLKIVLPSLLLLLLLQNYLF
jgi:hypothetical protein